MTAKRKVQRNPESQGRKQDDRPDTRRETAAASLGTALQTGDGDAADPRLEERGGTEPSRRRRTTPSDTNEPAEANQRRQSDDIDTAGL